MTALTPVQTSTALSRLIDDRARVLNLSNRDVAAVSQRHPELGTISQGAVGQYRRGNHPARPSDATLQVFARVLDLPVAELRRAAGVPEPLGTWTPPVEASLMDRRQRKHVETLIKMLVTTEPKAVA